MKLVEQEFYDYKTDPVTGTQVIDAHKTGMSFYDDFLSDNKKTQEWLRDNKNLEGKVVMMSPEEYYKACSDYGFSDDHPSVERLKAGRRHDTKILSHLKDVLTVYKRRFPMPMLNKAHRGQEGLHRMMVIGDLFGWDHKVPVLIVDWADKQKAYEMEKRKSHEKIVYRIKQAVIKALRYKFRNIDELQDQLQWELDDQFDYDDDIDVPVQFDFSSDEENKRFKVSVGDASYEFDYEDVQFFQEQDVINDEVTIEEYEDFLRRYFGDDWRVTHPHLKVLLKSKN